MNDLRGLAAREALATSQPAPKDAGALVTPSLLAWLERRSVAVDELVAIVLARDEFGRKKYGQGLRAGDGRDTSADFGQELADALQYAFKAKMQGADLSTWRELHMAIGELL